MENITEIKECGVSLGYEGEALRTFIKEQQAIMRDERSAIRQKEKEDRELKLALEKIEFEREKAEHELGLARENAEREVKLRELQYSHELHILDVKSKVKVCTDTAPVRGPKIPPFEEGKDEIDSYLKRFEVYATAQKWDPELWATHLSALLKGRALDVYALMPPERALDYDELKLALLRRYDLTVDGFKRKFRSSRPEQGETFTQFAVRQDSYLTRWVDMAKTDKTYEGLFDLMVRDQFLHMCSHELALFLKERTPKSLKDMAELADQYKEARNASAMSLSTPVSQKSTNAVGFVQEPERGKRQDSTYRFQNRERRCFNCGGLGHIAVECRARGRNSRDNSRDRYGSPNRKYTPYRSGSPERRVTFQDSTQSDRDGSGRKPDVKVCGACTTTTCGSVRQSVVKHTLFPVVTSSCKTVKVSNMPTSKGQLDGLEVSVLRDTGCSGVVVRRSMVPTTYLTGVEQTCVLANGSKTRVPVAKLFVDCPYYVGEVEAWCMEDPVYDIIIGNIEGAKEPFRPDVDWVVSAIQTRQQVRNAKKPYQAMSVPEPIAGITPKDIEMSQKGDHSLDKIRRHMADAKDIPGKNQATIRYFEKNGLIYREFQSVRVRNGQKFSQLVVPSQYRKSVLKLAHESQMAGHMSTRRTIDRVLKEFFWPGLHSDAKAYCRSCDICQRTVPKGRISKVPLGKLPLIETPFSRVAVDLIGPLHPVTDKGNRYILTLVDYATRYPEAVALPSIETERVAEALLDIFSRIGFPREMLTDMGAQFTGSLMKEVCRLISLKQLTTTPYHPMCNGLVERFNGTLKQMLKRVCAEKPNDWDKYLNAVLFAYREIPQESLGFSPFDLVYGWSVRGPMKVLKELWSKDIEDPEVKTTYQYVVDLRERLDSVNQIARENLMKASSRQKVQFNRKAHHRDIQVGDKVLVLLPKKANKLLLQWSGPYPVVDHFGHYDYKVKIRGKLKSYHANLLKKYVERGEPDVDSVMHQVSMAVIENMIDTDDDTGNDVIEDVVLSGPLAKENFTKVNISDCLTHEQQQEIRSLLEEFADVLTDLPGRTSLIRHDIKLTTDVPIRQRPYPIPFAKLPDVNKELDNMLDMDIIEPSESPYASPIVLVGKKDNTIRFCTDMRNINRITVFDAEPIPNVEEMFSKFSNNRYFSRFDLTKGYWQVPLTDSAKEKTAFQTPRGLFQFKVMSFGLVNAPMSFSRLMRKLLHGLPNIENFIDDIIVFTKSWKDHMAALRGLFTRLRQACLTAKPSKCCIGFDRIECLGHVVGNDRLLPHPSNIAAIEKAERPTTKKQIRSFLGLVGFYHKFVPNFSAIAAPLTDMTKKGHPNKVKWSDSAERAFLTLKGILTTEPVLKLPNLSEPFLVQTDASECGIGGILLQSEGALKFPVAYASRKLKASEKNYSVIEKECLAIVWTIQKFIRYLYGVEFVLETDHRPLVHLNKAKVSNARLMRWALLLQPFRFRIVAVKGKDNVGADYLSRQ